MIGLWSVSAAVALSTIGKANLRSSISAQVSDEQALGVFLAFNRTAIDVECHLLSFSRQNVRRFGRQA
jgi:hypothetical protein